MSHRAPIRQERLAAYLISNAQVTGAPTRTIRRRRGSVLTTMRSLVVSGDAQSTGPLRAVRLLAGNCEAPLGTTEVGGKHARPMLDTWVRCRRCPACLKQRRNVWSARARHEIGMHPRTWMLTLTCAPQAHLRQLMLAESNARRRGVDPGEWTPDEVFAQRWGEFGKEVTKYLKRLRATGAHMSYLQVVEAHKSGLPHVHMLIHERSGVTYRRLTDNWLLGFSHAKLVEGPEAALYVTKYLMKSALARVRASLHYGKSTPSRPSSIERVTPSLSSEHSEERKPHNVSHPHQTQCPMGSANRS